MKKIEPSACQIENGDLNHQKVIFCISKLNRWHLIFRHNCGSLVELCMCCRSVVNLVFSPRHTTVYLSLCLNTHTVHCETQNKSQSVQLQVSDPSNTQSSVMPCRLWLLLLLCQCRGSGLNPPSPHQVINKYITRNGLSSRGLSIDSRAVNTD